MPRELRGAPKTALAETNWRINEDLLEEVTQTGVGVPQAEKAGCVSDRDMGTCRRHRWSAALDHGAPK